MASSSTRFIDFQNAQNNILPPALAASYLGVSRARLHQLAKKGRLEYMTISGRRYYGIKSMSNYIWWRSAFRARTREYLAYEKALGNVDN